MLKVAILGYGGIARAHRRGYELLASQGAPVELVALCDVDPEQFASMITINQGGEDAGVSKSYATYTDLEEMLEKEELDIIDICLPSYLHCEYTVKLLKRGYHVQTEKPMGLNAAQCQEMLTAARESGKRLMVGMCLRFEPLYLELKKLIDEETYGKVYAAHFERLSAIPEWGYQNWFQDYDRSGGVALDMHIHDVDMIRFLFGDPQAVSALTSDSKMKCTTINSTFVYDDKLVTAFADWGLSKTTGFRMSYRVCFERATVCLEAGEIRVYPDEGEAFKLEVSDADRMAEEALFFARTIRGELENEKNTPADAAGSVSLVGKLMESAQKRGIQVEV